jgi:aminoglycoside N3'-acetyltransferase
MALKKIGKKIFFKAGSFLKSHLVLPIKRVRWKKYGEYDSNEIEFGLKKIGISKGDSLFIMCSVKKVYEKTGTYFPVDTFLKDVFDVIGDEGTVLILAFSDNREGIIEGTVKFDKKRTPVRRNGTLSKYIFEMEEAVRSLHPIFSALAIGKNAQAFCSTHHLSPFPYDEHSPFRKLTDLGGKFLGVGQGVEVFTPSHMIEDYFKKDFCEWVYSDNPLEFSCIDENSEEVQVESYVRGRFNKMLDLAYHFKQLKIESQRHVTPKGGVLLFSMPMDKYLDASVKKYREHGFTIWSTNAPRWAENLVQFYRKVKYYFSQL